MWAHPCVHDYLRTGRVAAAPWPHLPFLFRGSWMFRRPVHPQPEATHPRRRLSHTRHSKHTCRGGWMEGTARRVACSRGNGRTAERQPGPGDVREKWPPRGQPGHAVPNGAENGAEGDAEGLSEPGARLGARGLGREARGVRAQWGAFYGSRGSLREPLRSWILRPMCVLTPLALLPAEGAAGWGADSPATAHPSTRPVTTQPRLLTPPPAPGALSQGQGGATSAGGAHA